MTTPATTRYKFFNVLSETEKNIGSFVNNPDADMTRHRKCGFVDTILVTLTSSMYRTNTELFTYFQNNIEKLPTKSAFTQQRKKLNLQLFPHILKEFNKAIPAKRTFMGFHLIAADGSDINLPTDKKDTIYRVKQPRSSDYYYQMHLNVLYDVCENRFVSGLIQPRPQMDENAAFCELLEECDYPENTIFIMDRLYSTYNTIAQLSCQNRYFLIRAKSPESTSLTKGILESDTIADKVVSLSIARSQKAFKSGHFDVTRVIRSDRKFDLIEPDDKETVFTMSLRFTCVELSDGNYEYLVSNLPEELFSISDIQHLYWRRWQIETSFKSLKYALSLECLHSFNRDLIKQEIYARMVIYNFTSLIHAFAQYSKELIEICKHRKYKYNVSFCDAVPIAKHLLRHIIDDDTVKELLLTHLTPVRKGTPSERKKRSITAIPLGYRA